MDNPSFEDDGKKLPGPSSSEIKSDVNNKRTVVAGLFTWREVLEGMVGRNPKLFNVGSIVTLVVAYHAYFFFCLYRWGLLRSSVPSYTPGHLHLHCIIYYMNCFHHLLLFPGTFTGT